MNGPAWSDATWHSIVHAPSLRVSGPIHRPRGVAEWTRAPAELAPARETAGVVVTVDRNGDGKPGAGDVIGVCSTTGGGLLPILTMLLAARRKRQQR